MSRKRRTLRETPKPRSRQMTQNRVRSRGKHGAETLTLRRKARIPNREHTAVKTVQATDSNRPMDRAFRIAQWPGQLVERNDSVLALGEIRKLPVPPRVRRTLVSHSGTKVRRTLILPPG